LEFGGINIVKTHQISLEFGGRNIVKLARYLCSLVVYGNLSSPDIFGVWWYIDIKTNHISLKFGGINIVKLASYLWSLLV